MNTTESPSDRPLISIVTVTMNSGSLLRETIESVAVQKYRDFEYLVIDGASSDDSLETLEHFSDVVDIVVSEKDEGVYHAMNKAVTMASGEYVYFLNAGDVLLHDKVLELVATQLNNNGPSIFVGSGIRCSKDTGKLIFLEYQGEQFNLDFFRKRTINHQCVFAHRQLFGLKKFDLSYQMLADFDWLIHHFVLKNVSVVYENIGVVRYLNEGFSNSNYELYLNEKTKVLNRYSDSSLLAPNGRASTVDSAKKNLFARLKRAAKRLFN